MGTKGRRRTVIQMSHQLHYVCLKMEHSGIFSVQQVAKRTSIIEGCCEDLIALLLPMLLIDSVFIY